MVQARGIGIFLTSQARSDKRIALLIRFPMAELTIALPVVNLSLQRAWLI